MTETQKDVYNLMFQAFPDVLTVPQLSRMLNINEKAAYQLVREKRISHFRVGRVYRIPKVEVFRFLSIAADEVDSQNCQIATNVVQYPCQ